MRFLFLMDPLETVNIDTDTTFALMLESARRGHEVFYLPVGAISLENGKIQFNAHPVIPQPKHDSPFDVKPPVILTPRDVDTVFIRPNPPFNEKYLMSTWLLDHCLKETLVINSPAGIRNTNEKIWATQFPSLTPETLISQDKQSIIAFIKKNREVIAKPTDAYGGAGVFHLTDGQENMIVTLETLSLKWQKEIIIQKYVPDAKKGDKRILLLNGEALGAVLRLHVENDHRNNFCSGGRAIACAITDRDREIIETLRPHLLAQGLYFVGIDIIGNYLIEVNVTSPTCLLEMNALYGVSLETQAIDFVEKLIKNQTYHTGETTHG